MSIIGLRRGKRDSGAALVEMAIITPLLLVLVFGIIEFGWMLRCYQAVGQAAREGARSGALDSDGNTIAGRVNDTARDIYNLVPTRFSSKRFYYRTYQRSGTAWDPTPSGWTEFSGTTSAPAADASHYVQVKVTLSYKYPFLTGSMFSWLGAAKKDTDNTWYFPLGQSVVMRKE